MSTLCVLLLVQAQHQNYYQYYYLYFTILYNLLYCSFCNNDFRQLTQTICFSSSRGTVFYWKVVLKTFATFTGKHLCLSLFLIKLPSGLQLYFKKRLYHRFFSVNITKLFDLLYF